MIIDCTQRPSVYALRGIWLVSNDIKLIFFEKITRFDILMHVCSKKKCVSN